MKTRGLIKKLFFGEEGQGIVEYALILALIVVGMLAVIGGLSGNLQSLIEGVSGEVDKAREEIVSD